MLLIACKPIVSPLSVPPFPFSSLFFRPLCHAHYVSDLIWISRQIQWGELWLVLLFLPKHSIDEELQLVVLPLAAVPEVWNLSQLFFAPQFRELAATGSEGVWLRLPLEHRLCLYSYLCHCGCRLHHLDDFRKIQSHQIHSNPPE